MYLCMYAYNVYMYTSIFKFICASVIIILHIFMYPIIYIHIYDIYREHIRINI